LKGPPGVDVGVRARVKEEGGRGVSCYGGGKEKKESGEGLSRFSPEDTNGLEVGRGVGRSR